MDSLVSLINEVVKTPPPSLNNNSRVSEILKDGYEPIKLEGNDRVFSPIISNKDNSNTKKKTQQKNNTNSDSFIEHELTSKEERNLEVLSQQSSSQPKSLFPEHTAGRKLSTITEKTEILSTVQQSELESQLLRPTTALSRSSSSDGSTVSLKESEVSDLSVLEEEKFDFQDICVTKKSRRVYSNNRDAISKTLKDQKNFPEEHIKSGEQDEQISSDNSTISTNIIPITTPILSSNLNSSDFSSTSSILNPSPQSLSLDSVHSDKSILGDLYNNIAVPTSPSSTISSSSSLKNIKEGRVGLHKEDKYPSPGTYFSHKSGPMGDLSGGLSPNKRPKFYASNKNERWPAPSIDPTRERISGRMAREGWPSSQRRMQLVSPRFKSLTDLVEAPECSEQQLESSSCRTNLLNTPESSNGRIPLPTPTSLGPICEGPESSGSEVLVEEEEEEEEEEKDVKEDVKTQKVLKEPEMEKQKEKVELKQDMSKPGKFLNSSRTKKSRFIDLISNDDDSPILNQPFGKRQPMLSPGKRTLSNSKNSLLQDIQSMSEEEKVIEEQEKTKSRSEKRLSGSFSSNLGGICEEEESEGLEEQKEQVLPLPDISRNGSNRKTRTLSDFFPSKEKSIEESKSEPSRRPISRLFPSIQSRRTMPQLTVRTMSISETDEDEEEEETEISSDYTSSRYIPPSDQSDISTSPITVTPPVSSVPVTPKSTSWRWPKRPFSPARDKHREELVKSDDNPANHIGKVGNLWGKKTLGQLRKYHKRKSPSMLSRGLSLSSPLRESSSPLQSPVSDISDSKKSPAVSIPEQPLETINEEEDEEIGIWSSEEVDLTDSEKKSSTPTSINSILNSPIIEEVDEPQSMKVSPEHLTIAGGPYVSRESPNTSTASLALRNNPSSSSLAKHNAKPLFETTFTISNMTDNPLIYEILWPAFRFDITPAYGVVKPQGVMVVKISVMHKHLTAGSKREDAKKLMGVLKGSEKSDNIKLLMSRTRILVLCENGERREVTVDIVPAKKEKKGGIEPLRSSSKNERDENGNFISRFSKSGTKSFSRTVDDLIKAARARTRTKKQTKPENKPKLTTKDSKGKSTISSTGKSPSAPPLRRSTSSKPPSRSSSPEGSNRNRVVRKKASSSSLRSRPDTPDTYRTVNERKLSVSPLPITRSRTPDESKPIRQLPQRKNFLYVGAPGNISCSPTTIRETNHSTFRIHNPTNKPVTWHLTTATNPFLRRSESTSSSAQKINDEVFLIMKTSGFLRPGQTEKVVVGFHPVIVGTYHQNFMLEDSMNTEGAGGLGGVSVRIQGEGKVDTSTSVIRPDIRRSTGSRIKDFEVSETEVHIPATRVGKRRSVAIKIHNPSGQLIRIKCKIGDANEASAAISIPLSSVQIKPHTFVVLPIRFQPKETGEIRGIIKLQAVGRTETQVEIVAEGVPETSP